MGMVWYKTSVDKRNKLLSIRKESGRKGGMKKAEVYGVIQEKLVELINVLAPEKGWGSKSAAVRALIEPLWKFVEESDFMIDNQSKKYRLATASQDALAETIIKSWSQNNESIEQAFDANVRKK